MLSNVASRWVLLRRRNRFASLGSSARRRKTKQVHTQKWKMKKVGGGESHGRISSRSNSPSSKRVTNRPTLATSHSRCLHLSRTRRLVHEACACSDSVSNTRADDKLWQSAGSWKQTTSEEELRQSLEGDRKHTSEKFLAVLFAFFGVDIIFCWTLWKRQH